MLVDPPHRAVAAHHLIHARARRRCIHLQELLHHRTQALAKEAHLRKRRALAHRVEHDQIELLPCVEERVCLQAELQQRRARARARKDEQHGPLQLLRDWGGCAQRDRSMKGGVIPCVILAQARRLKPGPSIATRLSAGGQPLDRSHEVRDSEGLLVEEQVVVAKAHPGQLLDFVPQFECSH